MTILNLALNGIAALGVAVFVAYITMQSGSGLFTKLPPAISDVFTHNTSLQFVALAVALAALTAKIFVSRALKRRKAEGGRAGRAPRR